MFIYGSDYINFFTAIFLIDTGGLNRMNKLSKLRKKLMLVLVCVISLVTICGCKSTKLADGYDKELVEKTAIEIIEDIQIRGAKVVLEEKMREDFIENIELDEMDASCKSSVSMLGNFLTYTQKTVIGRHYDETDEDFAVALITAVYEEGEVNYTLTFDKDMTLVGFYPNN